MNIENEILKLRYRIFKFVLSKVKNVDDAEDVTQVTMIKALKNASDIEDATKISSWLHSVAYRSVLDHWQKRSHLRLNPNYDQIDKRFDTEKNFLTKNMIRNVESYLANQSPILEGVSNIDVIMSGAVEQEDYEITFSCLRTRINRTKKKLKELREAGVLDKIA